MAKILFMVNTEGPHPEKHGFENFHSLIEQWAVSKKIDVDTLSFNELVFSLSNEGMRIISPFTGTETSDYDLVVFKNVRDYQWKAREVAQFLDHADIPYIDARIEPSVNSKYSSQVIYSKIGLPYIPSHYAQSKALLKAIDDGYITPSYPAIVKDAHGSKGSNNFLVKDVDELRQVLVDHTDMDWIVQPFIPNECDYRLTIFGSKAAVVVRRSRKNTTNTHLNNISSGAAGELIDPTTLPEKLVDDAIAAAAAEGLQVAGVDVIIDSETGKWYIMEVNGSPALAAGVFVEEHMKAYTDYLERLLERAQTSL